MLKKLMAGIGDLGWTLGGTGLVLITLSGQTRTWGIYISVASLVVYFVGLAFQKED